MVLAGGRGSSISTGNQDLNRMAFVSNSVAWKLLQSSERDVIAAHAGKVIQQLRDYWQTDWHLENAPAEASLRGAIDRGFESIQKRIAKHGGKGAVSFALGLNTSAPMDADWVIWVTPALIPRTRLTLFNRAHPDDPFHPPPELMLSLVESGTFDFGTTQKGTLWIGETSRFYVAKKLGLLHSVSDQLSMSGRDSAALPLIEHVHSLLNSAGQDRLTPIPKAEVPALLSKIDALVRQSCPPAQLKQMLKGTGVSYRSFLSGGIIGRVSKWSW
jgi:hypothetical protein